MFYSLITSNHRILDTVTRGIIFTEMFLIPCRLQGIPGNCWAGWTFKTDIGKKVYILVVVCVCLFVLSFKGLAMEIATLEIKK